MISVIQNGQVYEIKFPYNVDVLEMVRNIPGRRWEADRKLWTIPTDKLGFFLNAIEGTVYASQLNVVSSEQINVNASYNVSAEIPDVDISNVNFYVKKGCKPFQHQLDTLKFDIVRHNKGIHSGFLLCDSMGTGKSCTVINVATYAHEHRNAKHCLIICCVNTAKYTWEAEIESATQGKYKGYILGSRIRRDGTINKIGSGKQKLEDLDCGMMYGAKGTEPLPYFLIVNIEAFHTKSGKVYAFSEKILEMINSKELDVIAIDEVHRNMSMSSIQGKQILSIKKRACEDVEWIPMTGTPIVNSPTDLFLPLKLVDAHSFKDYWSWCRHFCVYGGFGGYDIIGYKNIPAIQNMLKQHMLRRLKENILDLPPKVEIIEYVENSAIQQKLYKEIKEDLKAHRDEIVQSPNPNVKFLRLRQVNGCPEVVDSSIQVDTHYLTKNAKSARAFQLIQDIVGSGEKVLVFSNWLDPLRTLYRFLATKYKICVYTGTMDQATREQHKQAFMTDSSCQILLGTIPALGVSANLSMCNNIIFLDEPWTEATKSQAEDRCHRADSTKPVNIYTLLTQGTIDERVHSIVYRKGATSDYILDNKLDFKHCPELFDILLD